jgi:hypothetical protein
MLKSAMQVMKAVTLLKLPPKAPTQPADLAAGLQPLFAASGTTAARRLQGCRLSS